MKPRNRSLHDKSVQKITLKDGQQVTGKVIGFKKIDEEKTNILLDTGKELVLLTIKMNEETRKLERGKNVIVKGHKQGLSIEAAQKQTMKSIAKTLL